MAGRLRQKDYTSPVVQDQPDQQSRAPSQKGKENFKERKKRRAVPWRRIDVGLRRLRFLSLASLPSATVSAWDACVRMLV